MVVAWASSEGGQKWLNPGYILSGHLPRFAFGLDVIYEKRRTIKNDSKWKDGFAINLEGEDYGIIDFGD